MEEEDFPSKMEMDALELKKKRRKKGIGAEEQIKETSSTEIALCPDRYSVS